MLVDIAARKDGIDGHYLARWLAFDFRFLFDDPEDNTEPTDSDGPFSASVNKMI